MLSGLPLSSAWAGRVSPAAQRPPFVVFFSIVGHQTRTTTVGHHVGQAASVISTSRVQGRAHGGWAGRAAASQPAPPAGGTVMHVGRSAVHRIIGRVLSSYRQRRRRAFGVGSSRGEITTLGLRAQIAVLEPAQDGWWGWGGSRAS